MARKVDLIAPHLRADQHALTVNRWLKAVGDPVAINEPVAELLGDDMTVYVHAPDDGVLSTISVAQGMNVLSGAVLGIVTVVSKNAIDWENFDQVTVLIEDYAEKAKNFRQSRDANDALAQLLGVGENLVFQGLSIENQNKFLQNVVDQFQQNGLSPADVTQKLLEGLYLRPPVNAPAAPVGPGLGMRGPAGPGGAGGGVQYTGVTPQQQQGYAPPPGQIAQHPLPQPPAPQFFVPPPRSEDAK